MRLNFICKTDCKLIDYDYQKQLSSLIYKIMEIDNPALSKKIHDSRDIKNFCFSTLFFEKFKCSKNKIELLSPNFNFIVTSSNKEILQSLLNIDFSLKLNIGKFTFKIEKIEVCKVSCDLQKLLTLNTPLVLNITNNVFIDPDHKDFQKLFFKNLIKKYKGNKTQEFLDNLESYKINIITPVKRKYRNNSIGYLFSFKLDCPIELINVGVLSGFGLKNSQGFGFVK